MIDLIWRPRLITGRGSVGAGFDGDDANVTDRTLEWIIFNEILIQQGLQVGSGPIGIFNSILGERSESLIFLR
jgi:hypothetical protein